MVKLIRFSIFTLLITLPMTAWAQQPPLSIKGVNDAGMQVLLAGMAYGIGSANFFLRMEGRGLYCPPRGVLTTPALLRDLAASQLKGPQKPDVVAIAALDGLRQKFPCR
jgi:hypothetical protein